MTTPPPVPTTAPTFAGPARGVRRRFTAGPAGPSRQSTGASSGPTTSDRADGGNRSARQQLDHFLWQQGSGAVDHHFRQHAGRVRNKDTGPAGSALNDMVGVLRGFDLDGGPEQEARFFRSAVRQGCRWRRSSSSTNWCAIRSIRSATPWSGTRPNC